MPGPVYPTVTPRKLLSTDFDGGTLACARTSWDRSRQGSWRWIKGGSSLENSSPGEQPRQFSSTVSKPLFCCADSWQFSYHLSADGDWRGPASSMQELREAGVKT